MTLKKTLTSVSKMERTRWTEAEVLCAAKDVNQRGIYGASNAKRKVEWVQKSAGDLKNQLDLLQDRRVCSRGCPNLPQSNVSNSTESACFT